MSTPAGARDGVPSGWRRASFHRCAIGCAARQEAESQPGPHLQGVVVIVADREVQRVEWYHDFAKDRRLQLFMDVFNLTDQSRATEVETIVGPQLGQTATENFARNIRFGVGYTW